MNFLKIDMPKREYNLYNLLQNHNLDIQYNHYQNNQYHHHSHYLLNHYKFPQQKFLEFQSCIFQLHKFQCHYRLFDHRNHYLLRIILEHTYAYIYHRFFLFRTCCCFLYFGNLMLGYKNLLCNL